MTDKNSEFKLNLDRVVFEITRWCNMQCEHCLRGEREKVRLKKEYIDNFLKDVNSISCLTITGGEPTLAVDIIEYILQVCIDNDIMVHNVWVTTNGKIKSRKFLNVMTRFIEYTQEFDGELSGVSLSTDQFHDNLPEENYWFYRDFEYFDSCKDIGTMKHVMPEGRALDTGVYTNTGRTPDEETLVFDYWEETKDLYVSEGTIYLNAKGNILFGCDFSFDHQDQISHFNISEQSIKDYIFDREEVHELIYDLEDFDEEVALV